MNRYQLLAAKFAIACAFVGPLASTICAALAAYQLLNETGPWASVGRWASMAAATFAVGSAAKIAHHVITTGNLPR